MFLFNQLVDLPTDFPKRERILDDDEMLSLRQPIKKGDEVKPSVGRYNKLKNAQKVQNNSGSRKSSFEKVQNCRSTCNKLYYDIVSQESGVSDSNISNSGMDNSSGFIGEDIVEIPINYSVQTLDSIPQVSSSKRIIPQISIIEDPDSSLKNSREDQELEVADNKITPQKVVEEVALYYDPELMEYVPKSKSLSHTNYAQHHLLLDLPETEKSQTCFAATGVEFELISLSCLVRNVIFHTNLQNFIGTMSDFKFLSKTESNWHTLKDQHFDTNHKGTQVKDQKD